MAKSGGYPVKLPVPLVSSEVAEAFFKVVREQKRHTNKTFQAACMREILERGIKAFYDDLKLRDEI